MATERNAAPDELQNYPLYLFGRMDSHALLHVALTKSKTVTIQNHPRDQYWGGAGHSKLSCQELILWTEVVLRQVMLGS